MVGGCFVPVQRQGKMEKAYGIQEKKSKTEILGPLVNEF
jgi:hypothetical protein